MIDTRYDAQSDILYVRLAEARIVESEEVSPGVVLDFDDAGRIVAVEFQRAKAHLSETVDLAALTAA